MLWNFTILDSPTADHANTPYFRVSYWGHEELEPEVTIVDQILKDDFPIVNVEEYYVSLYPVQSGKYEGLPQATIAALIHVKSILESNDFDNAEVTFLSGQVHLFSSNRRHNVPKHWNCFAVVDVCGNGREEAVSALRERY